MLIVTPTDLGNIVRDRRTDLGLSQAALADAIGMSRQWVVRFENGHSGTATVEHLLAIADALHLDLETSPS